MKVVPRAAPAEQPPSRSSKLEGTDSRSCFLKRLLVSQSDTATLENLIQEKDQEITRVRTEYYRLVEQFKKQVKEKQEVVEQLTMTDTNKMKSLLVLRNKVLEFEKKNEKQTNENVKDMEN